MNTFNQHYLETLTTPELRVLANQYDIDVPPETERIFIIQELLENTREVNSDFNDILEHEELSYIEGTALLPQQYNITAIEVMIRDPLWIFVLWEVGAHDRENYEHLANFAGYCLKITALYNEENKTTTEPFYIPINNYQGSRYINIPSMHTFHIDVCARYEEKDISLISSRSLEMPVMFDPTRIKWNPFLKLSGFQDFTIIHHEERTARSK
ncbi:hypothetical protein PilKf_00659 [Pillotina sp. SPG140]|jgi:hypothetical protein